MTGPSAEKDAVELAVLREFWHTFWEDVTTVECACGLSAYEHEDASRLEVAQDKVATFYEQQGSDLPPADYDVAAALRAELVQPAARALHEHVCGTEWDEWNNPCSWAGEDAEPGLKSYPVCCEVDLSGVAGAVVDALLTRVLPPGGGDTSE
jgi:hypothetical protein